MVNSWKQFWSSEGRIGSLLCLLGIVFGLTIGVFSKDWAESFHSIEIVGYHIPPPLSFGIAAGLAVQLVSVLSIRIAMLNRNNKLDNLIVWLLFTMPFGILTIFNILLYSVRKVNVISFIDTIYCSAFWYHHIRM